MAEIVHYLGRTQEECERAGQSTICEGCKQLSYQGWMPEMYNRNPYCYAVDSLSDIEVRTRA